MAHTSLCTCRRCYEIKCNPSTFKDGYGDTLDREQVCKDPDASLVVQVGANHELAQRVLCRNIAH